MNDPMQSSTQGFGLEGRAYHLKKVTCFAQVDGCGGPLLRACFPVILEMSGYSRTAKTMRFWSRGEAVELPGLPKRAGLQSRLGLECHVLRRCQWMVSGWPDTGTELLPGSCRCQSHRSSRRDLQIGTDGDGLECHGMPRGFVWK